MRRLMRSCLSGMVVAAGVVATGASAQAAAAMTGGLGVAAAAAAPRFSAPVMRSIRALAGEDSIVPTDLNGDGKVDLALNDGSSILVLLGKGDGTFHRLADYRAGSDFGDLAVADLNGDGMPDLAASLGRRVSVLLNDGAGRFPRHTEFPGDGGSLGAADVDLDGRVDLVTVGEFGDQGLSVLLGQGAGRFARPRTFAGRGALDLAIGDVNGDGRPDVALSEVIARANSILPGPVSVRLGGGDGTFGPDHAIAPIPAEGEQVTLTDLNLDGKPDVLVDPVRGRGIFVLRGNGDATFARPAFVTVGRDLPVFTLVADFNGDGNPDIAADSSSGGLVVASGRGDGSFGHGQRVPRSLTQESGAVADFNGDGRPDLASVEDAACDLDICPPGTDVNHVLTWLNWTGLPAPRACRKAPCGSSQERHFGLG